MTILLTTCSFEKNKVAVPLKAEDLYTHPRIKTVRELAHHNKLEWFILSGLHGIVDPITLLEWYDQALTESMVSELAERATSQLGLVKERLQMDEIIFVAEKRETPGWEPYFEVIETACRNKDIRLKFLEADPQGNILTTVPQLMPKSSY